MNPITQLSVFLPNEAGSLNRACQVLAEHHVNIITLSLADTREYGILRMLSNDCAQAQKLLSEAGFVVKTTPVLAVPVEDRPGGLAEILKVLAEHQIDVLYMYAFPEGKNGRAVMVFRFADPDNAEKILNTAGFRAISSSEL